MPHVGEINYSQKGVTCKKIPWLSIQSRWSLFLYLLSFDRFKFKFLSVRDFTKKIKPLGSISSTFYDQLLRAQIPKAQKKLLDSTMFKLLFWNSFKSVFVLENLIDIVLSNLAADQNRSKQISKKCFNLGNRKFLNSKHKYYKTYNLWQNF